MVAIPQDAKTLAKSPDFLNKVKRSGIDKCKSICIELDTTPYHYERICFAAKFLANPDAYTTELARRIAIDPRIINKATKNGQIILTDANVKNYQGEICLSDIYNVFAEQVNAYLSQQWWRDPQDQGSRVYARAERIAKPVKALLQMVVGFGILILLGERAVPKAFEFIVNHDLLFQVSTLRLVGHGLAYAAGVELVYMLFTEGLDEALDPPMMGIAAAILVVASNEIDVGLGFAIALLVAALAGLFATKRYLFTIKVENPIIHSEPGSIGLLATINDHLHRLWRRRPFKKSHH